MTAILTVLAAGLVAAVPAQAAAWSSSDRWGTWSNGGYTVRNNIWGSGAGPQTIWANSYSNWGVWADHPNTGGVKSYPHAGRNIGK
ncbi:glycoside hydrolase family 12 protein [Kribbella swartbergensis]